MLLFFEGIDCVEIPFKDFGFYLINESYLKHHHNIDEEVRYDEYQKFERKPFMGISADVNGYN